MILAGVMVAQLNLVSEGNKCSKCGVKIGYRNKSGLCRACCRAVLNRRRREVESFA